MERRPNRERLIGFEQQSIIFENLITNSTYFFQPDKKLVNVFHHITSISLNRNPSIFCKKRIKESAAPPVFYCVRISNITLPSRKASNGETFNPYNVLG